MLCILNERKIPQLLYGHEFSSVGMNELRICVSADCPPLLPLQLPLKILDLCLIAPFERSAAVWKVSTAWLSGKPVPYQRPEADQTTLN